MNIINFDSEIINNLQLLAYKNDIIIQNIYNLSTETPDFSVVNRQGIFMNCNYETPVSYDFRLAHELSHLIYGNADIQKIYTFSEFGHRYEELLAHQNAIRILMSIDMPSTPLTFMSYYCVPSWLEKDVIKTYKELTAAE
ncbi:ImmA/IrrE family metallo-endopeptidase [Leuconostoc carnosum]|uniref:ImmA/IrrE family metallo-endopeptidase n=1 Tax=Leuconostoc carnosum TaxID=1252 RepID=UPI00123C1851|nr:ImmA/IrrE family metallo-endopeptidase [Leuconostoc carnosum]KAA8327825.1 ImmA/IrrE family metallo-endopeptidase [Leuconostoc carnosum]KAA8368465.1 ImmA/IrrE family metallo-endopeptidase [Leuconostoc carnosum]KAA8372391.1 ImmA/IrrE family metallo-endopeptidase [Leuconostoc carnosum]KAA8375291.1 ImmA/IrrE family metallo-endopeptidase [Leuconostoc carnosum]